MGKASKKDWYTDIVYIRNVFAYLTVCLNPIRIEAKLERYTHTLAAVWVLYMWDTMMPRVLNEFIKQEAYQVKVRVANQRELCLEQSAQVFGRY